MGKMSNRTYLIILGSVLLAFGIVILSQPVTAGFFIDCGNGWATNDAAISSAGFRGALYADSIGSQDYIPGSAAKACSDALAGPRWLGWGANILGVLVLFGAWSASSQPRRTRDAEPSAG